MEIWGTYQVSCLKQSRTWFSELLLGSIGPFGILNEKTMLRIQHHCKKNRRERESSVLLRASSETNGEWISALVQHYHTVQQFYSTGHSQMRTPVQSPDYLFSYLLATQTCHLYTVQQYSSDVHIHSSTEFPWPPSRIRIQSSLALFHSRKYPSRSLSSSTRVQPKQESAQRQSRFLLTNRSFHRHFLQQPQHLHSAITVSINSLQ